MQNFPLEARLPVKTSQSRRVVSCNNLVTHKKNSMNFLGPSEGIMIFIFLAFIYIIPIIFIIYWMLKMLKNSNESLKINKELLNHLKSKNIEK